MAAFDDYNDFYVKNHLRTNSISFPIKSVKQNKYFSVLLACWVFFVTFATCYERGRVPPQIIVTSEKVISEAEN